MREEQAGRRTESAKTDVGDVHDARRAQLSSRNRHKVEVAAVARPIGGKHRVDLGTRLVAARTRARADHRLERTADGASAECRHPGLDDAAGQAAPAAVHHRHAARPGDRNRQAIGHVDRDSGLTRGGDDPVRRDETD